MPSEAGSLGHVLRRGQVNHGEHANRVAAHQRVVHEIYCPSLVRLGQERDARALVPRCHAGCPIAWRDENRCFAQRHLCALRLRAADCRFACWLSDILACRLSGIVAVP